MRHHLAEAAASRLAHFGLKGVISLELRDIEVFLTLAEELHFRRTASRLYISAGRVSQTVSAMEKELGAPLFIRNSRHVRLSPLGEQFKKDVSVAVSQLYQAIREARATAQGVGQVLRVGYALTIRGPWVMALASRFEALHPPAKVSLKALPMGAGLTLLDQGRIDVLLTWSPGGNGAAVQGGGLTTGPVLLSEERGLLVPDDHPLASLAEISIEEIADYEVLDFPHNVSNAFLEAWTPGATPSGKNIRKINWSEAEIWGEDIQLADLFTAVARTRTPHLTIRSLLVEHSYPGLSVIPVPDLPPCVLVTAWREGLDRQLIREFVESMDGIHEPAAIG